MKNSKVLKKLSFKVRHQALFMCDQSRDFNVFFIRPFFPFKLPLKPLLEHLSFSSKVAYLNRIKRTHILRTNISFQVNMQARDYRVSTLRACHLFYHKKTAYKMIRPLLDFKRESITMICKDLLISVYPDKSNRLLQYSRNRIRKQIIPSLKYFLNPQVENSLFKIAELLKKEQSLTCSLLKNNLRNVRL